MIDTKKAARFISNLNEEGLRQLATQLLLYPEGKEFIEKSIEEFDRFYKFPVGFEKEKGDKKWK